MDSHAERCWVEVDLAALVRNASAMRQRSGKPLLPMVKGDAYGLGAVEVCRALEGLDPWGHGVGTLDEARELRRAGIRRRVLVFTPLLPAEYREARELGVTPTLGSAESLTAWIAAGGGPWHLAIDTGMHRSGIEWWRIGELSALLASSPPEGAFTHFHSPDVERLLQEQLARFRDAIRAMPSRPSVVHCENGPAVERHAPSPWDMVRPGVFLYGVGGGPESKMVPEPVVHLRARVVALHTVRRGETVSYGATWTAPSDRRVATLAIGYADGYRRLFSSRGEAIVAGARAPVVGRVTMDMTMIDVTDVPCAVGDVATLLGRDGDDHLDINRICDAVDLLPYEMLVGLKLRARRVYLPSPGTAV